MTYPAPGRIRSNRQRKAAGRTLNLETLEDRTLLSTGSGSSVIDLSGLAVKSSQYSSSDILVQFRPAALSRGVVPTLPGTTAGQQLGLVAGLYEINLKPGMTVAQALAAYRNDPLVVVADPDYSLTTSAIPNNPLFNQQSALLNTGQGGGTPGDDIGATHAWSVTTGSGSTVVALMDTGVDYDQQDLYQNIWINRAEIPKSRLAPSLGGTNPDGIQDYYHDGYVSWRDLNDPRNIGPGKITDVNGDGMIDAGDILAPMIPNAQGQDSGLGGWAYAGNTQDGDTAHPNDFIGWNFVDNTNNPLDGNGHGTHVAGIIGAMGNSGVGVTGIDWQVSMMPVQFLNSSGLGSISAFIAGLNYAVQHGAKISNNSWSGATDDPLLYAAIANAQTNGMIFVAAAGNGGANNDATPAYPSSFALNNIISVAAVDNNDQLASFSNYGARSVDVAAPGVNILSTLPNNTYGTLSGTSMATPMVTGVVALVWSEHPSWTYTQVIDQVEGTVDPVPGLQGKVLTGGVIDAARAVGYNPTPLSSPVAPSSLQVLSSVASGTDVNTLSTIELTFNTPVDPSALNNTNVALIGPNGQRITIQSFQTVAGSGGTQINLAFPTQTTSGSYTLLVGSGVASESGATLPSTYSNTFQLSSLFTFSTTTPLGIPDVSQIAASLTVQPSIVIGSLTVSVNIVNSIDGKIVLSLQAPDGTIIPLSNLEGGNGQSFLNTVFEDQGSSPIGSGSAPFTGSFKPESTLGQLTGKNAQGTWKLLVVDHGTNYHVLLTNWALTITSASGTAQLRVASESSASPMVATAAFPSALLLSNITSQALGHLALGYGQASLVISTSGSRLPSDNPPNVTPSVLPKASGSGSPSDELFASVDGIDRLADLRVMYPHAEQANTDIDLTETDSDVDELASIVAMEV